MNRTEKLRLLRKLAMLVILLATFAVASSTSVTQTGAAPCCSSCEEWEASCYTLPEPDQSACLNDVFRRCWRWCSFSC